MIWANSSRDSQVLYSDRAIEFLSSALDFLRPFDRLRKMILEGWIIRVEVNQFTQILLKKGSSEPAYFLSFTMLTDEKFHHVQFRDWPDLQIFKVHHYGFATGATDGKFHTNIILQSDRITAWAISFLTFRSTRGRQILMSWFP